MSNPYQPPSMPNYGSPNIPPGSPDREKLRAVAKYQKLVIYSLLVNILMNILAAGIRGAAGDQPDPILGLAILAIAIPAVIFALVSIYLLANQLHNPVVGVVCAILMFIPCIALITLLVINGQATSYLQRYGVKVGFMGADPNSI